jgi:hypothetical protein
MIRFFDCSLRTLTAGDFQVLEFNTPCQMVSRTPTRPDEPCWRRPPTAFWWGRPNFFLSAHDISFSRSEGHAPMIDLTSQKKQLATYKGRLARVKRGKVWASDHLGPYTPEEKIAEIACLKTRIARLEAPLPPWSCE